MRAMATPTEHLWYALNSVTQGKSIVHLFTYPTGPAPATPL